MRTPMIASLAVLAATLAMPADAQRLGRGRMMAPQIGVPQGMMQQGMPQPSLAPPNVPQMNVPQMNARQMNGPRTNQPQQRLAGPRLNGQHWGGQVNGRWIGGVQAPGGWNGYRRPGRGFRLPGYWFAPSFFIGNWSAYGLSSPPYGYRWSRYYDDAVLLDSEGRVYDSVSGIDWDSYDQAGGYEGYQQQDGGYGAPYAAPGVTYHSAPPPPPPYAGAVVQPAYPQGYTQSWSAGSGYWYPGGVTTTITIQQAPVVTTTTTTEYIEETVYRSPVRRSYRKPVRKWKPKPRCTCTCACR